MAEPALRELYWWTSVTDGDSTTFEEFVKSVGSSASADSFSRQLWKGSRVMGSATLGELGYGTGPFTWDYREREKKALSRFQADLGLPVSGSLDSATIRQLTAAARALRVQSVTLPSYEFYQVAGWITAHGTWKAQSNALAFPVNTADVECNAATGTCEVVRADVISDELGQLGRIQRNTYRITHWSETDVLATGEDWPGSDCHATLAINIPAKEVLVHQWCTGDSTLGAFSHGASEMTLKLVDGSRLVPPLDGGELKEVQVKVYGERERFLALRRRNMRVDGPQ